MSNSTQVQNCIFPNNKNDWRYVDVYGTDFRDELIMMAQTVDKLNLWDWFRNEAL